MMYYCRSEKLRCLTLQYKATFVTTLHNVRLMLSACSPRSAIACMRSGASIVHLSLIFVMHLAPTSNAPFFFCGKISVGKRRKYICFDSTTVCLTDISDLPARHATYVWTRCFSCSPSQGPSNFRVQWFCRVTTRI